MISLICLALVAQLASSVPLEKEINKQGYKPINQDYYVPNEIFASGDKDDCHPVERTVYQDECIPYVEKTCFTQQKEYCNDVFEKNCTTVIEEFEERECFDVTELICQLVENVQYEMVDETYTVQRCSRVTDRVCDTVYDLAVSTRDDFQCVDLEHQYCWDEEKVVKDRTCVFSVDFDCGKHKPVDGKGSVSCEKVPTKKCYDTPRKVKEEQCKPRSSKYCEKFTNEFPVPQEKQNCHTEPMKKCELEVRSRPKKAKKYMYHKDCKPVSRKVCDNCEKKQLKPVCDQVQRKVCSYKPEETCQEEKKQYCFKTEKIIVDKVCQGEKKEVFDETFNYV
uniref:Uncharacterized protein n=1 Tax=Acartia pacifica TaxID=335913 RepID=R9TI39_ACAPC|nr:hypothetical protein [Acartia pacifica]